MASDSVSNKVMANQAPETNVVTGALSYTGKHITQRLLALGKQVMTLTGHPRRPNPFGRRVSVATYAFDDPSKLVGSLEGATTLYNTYWVRFPYGGMTFEKAVENSIALIRAAEEAGLRRIVQISITHASEGSPFPYFRGKGLVDKAIQNSKLSYAILRPTVLFGHDDILINNIAWFLRRFPVFGIFGSGKYLVQPVHVEDLAELAVQAGHREDNLIMDVAGPETYTFEDLVRVVARSVRSKARIIHLRPRLAFLLIKLLGYLLHDVVLTWEEVQGLMANLLASDGPPTAPTHFSQWLDEHAGKIGKRYASELARHYR